MLRNAITGHKLGHEKPQNSVWAFGIENNSVKNTTISTDLVYKTKRKFLKMFCIILHLIPSRGASWTFACSGGLQSSNLVLCLL